jgi:hypothetical protein
VVNATPQPLYPRETPIVLVALWVPVTAWRGAKNLIPTGVRIPNTSLQLLLHGNHIIGLDLEIKHIKEEKEKNGYVIR